MLIQMIGHASIFIETSDCRIIIDPVLWDSFCEGLNSVCPKREVIHELLPKFDFIIISHRHLDHFDIRSLAYLNKKVTVLIPHDKLIEDCLEKLGFQNIICLEDFQEIKIGNTIILTTRSENRLPEFGIVVSDESGVFWNVVDTILSHKTISLIRSRYSTINFLLANWQPMLEINYQLNQSLSFPYSRYNQMLYDISLIQPKAIAPGANGFKYIQGASWLNRVVFPVTIEKFCEDVKMVCPEIKSTLILNPGDSLMFCNDEYYYKNDICHFVKNIIDDRDTLDFSPVMISGDLIDENREKHELLLVKEVIHEEICVKLYNFILENWNSLFLEHRRWKVIYQLEIFFINGSEKWVIDFSKEALEVTKGRNALANFFTYITASIFYDLINQNRDWDYIFCSGYYRTFNKIYLASPFGIIKPDNIEIEDPIALKFPYERKVDNILYKEIKKWLK